MLREQVYREESAKALTQVATGLKSSRVRARVAIFFALSSLTKQTVTGNSYCDHYPGISMPLRPESICFDDSQMCLGGPPPQS